MSSTISSATSSTSVALPLSPILPGSWLGVLGGGQLGRMFTHAAQSLGYRVCVLDPDHDSPAGITADRHICASYSAPSALRALADLCPSVSTEFENIPAQALEQLQSWGVFVAPNSFCVSLAQDRVVEKAFLSRCTAEVGMQVAPYAVLKNHAEIKAFITSVPPTFFPAILKTARMGYDGKGQITIDHVDALEVAWESLGGVPCILEQRLPLAHEVSVIIARGADGQCALYPLVENVHRSGILHQSIMPARCVDATLSAHIQSTAQLIAEKMGYVGVLCVEFFILEDGGVVANEIAPRPHNSGHVTVDACYTSQFEQQVRTMARLPLGSTEQFVPAVMLNLLGDLWFDSAARVRYLTDTIARPICADEPHEPVWNEILALPQAHLHLYGKSFARAGRKMGHLNFLGVTTDEVDKAYQQGCTLLGLKP